MAAQIVFLFDLDRCLPLECGLSTDTVDNLVGQLKNVCLKILCSSSPDPHHQLAHFSHRFYSSTEYFLVPDQLKQGQFVQVTEETFDLLDSALSERFEAITQTSKTNSFDSDALKKHVDSSQSHNRPHCQTLHKALEEIAILYNWDRPLMHSPVKKSGKQAQENVVYVFTKLPDGPEEMGKFMSNKPRGKTHYNHRELNDKLFNRTIYNVFKGDAKIRIVIVDTSNLFGGNNDDQTVKSVFRKCLQAFKGNVMSFEAFDPDPSCHLDKNVFSLPTSSVLVNSEMQEKLKKQETRLTFDASKEEQVLLNLIPYKNSEQGPKWSQVKVVGMLPENAVDHTQLYTGHYLVWPSQQKSTSSFASMLHYMRHNKQRLLVDMNQDDIFGILTPADKKSATVSTLGKEDSQLYAFIANVKLPGGHRQESKLSASDAMIVDFQLKNIDKSSLYWQQQDHDVKVAKHFAGDALEHYKVPEVKPFEEFLKTLDDDDDKNNRECKVSQRWWKDLQKSYLPRTAHPSKDRTVDFLLDPKRRRKVPSESDKLRRTSDESNASQYSKRSGQSSNQRHRSRGAELMRLGSKNAELRRNSREDPAVASSTAVGSAVQTQKCANTNLVAIKQQWLGNFEKDLENYICQDSDAILLKQLTKLQLDMLDHGEHGSLAALAEVTVSSLLKHLQAIGRPKTSLEELMFENFLVDPTTVSKRKTLKIVRMRDHKLQILYRIEIHWLTASQSKQKQLEDEILVHLRQISIWDNPREMLTFIQEVITPTYVNRQPELLCFLYEELNQPPPACLRAIFSPCKKSECSSPGPSSVISQHSEASYISNPSAVGNPMMMMAAGGDSNKSQPQIGRVKKLRRPASFDNKTLQIDVRDKKGKAVSKPVVNKSKVRKTPLRAAKSKKTPAKPSQGARRNLVFDDGQQQKSSPSKKMVQRTPKKGGDKTPKKGNKTPKKQAQRTPFKMTPGKTHQILVPETPKTKVGPRRKSDGTFVVNESPDLDRLKQAKTTPRRMAASLNLRRKTAFYSGTVSRNLMAAEEKMNASQIQNFSLPPQPHKELDLSADQGKANTSQVLFPFLMTRQRHRSMSSTDGNSLPLMSLEEPTKEEPRQSADVGRSMRRLFEDLDDLEVVLTSPRKTTPPQTYERRRSSRGLVTPTSMTKALASCEKFDQLLLPSNIHENENLFDDDKSETKSPKKTRGKSADQKSLLEPEKSKIKAETTPLSKKRKGQKVKALTSCEEFDQLLLPSIIHENENLFDDDKSETKSPKKTRGKSADQKPLLEPEKSKLKAETTPLSKKRKGRVLVTPTSMTKALAWSDKPAGCTTTTPEKVEDVFVNNQSPCKKTTSPKKSPPRKKLRSLTGSLTEEICSSPEEKKPENSPTTNVSRKRALVYSPEKKDPEGTPKKQHNSSSLGEVRPSRKKTLVNRMGIDDITLSAALSPKSSPMKQQTEQQEKVSEEQLPLAVAVVPEVPKSSKESCSTSKDSKSQVKQKKKAAQKTVTIPILKKPVPIFKSSSVDSIPILKKPVPIFKSTSVDSRPCRRKTITARMGIDDISLSEAVSPRASKTPIKTRRRSTCGEKRPVLAATGKGFSKKPLKVKFCSEAIYTIKDLPRKRKRNNNDGSTSSSLLDTSTVSLVQTDDEEEIEEEDNEVILSPIKSPGKYRYVVRTVESPRGEIKLQINRQQKPPKRPAATVQRISRRTAHELGISPDKLRQFMTTSPSPPKRWKLSNSGKENVDENQSSSSAPKTTISEKMLMKKIKSDKAVGLAAAAAAAASSSSQESPKMARFSPLTTSSLYTLTTSPILNCDLPKEARRASSNNSPARKRRRVSKKLYADD